MKQEYDNETIIDV